MPDNRKKISDFFNEIFDNQIIKYLDLAKNVENVPKKVLYFWNLQTIRLRIVLIL